MIASWMLGATVFTLLLGIAALAVERALRTTRFQTRVPWVIALGVALVWPVVAPVVIRTLSTPERAPLEIVNAPVISASAMISQQLPPVSTTWSERFGVALIVLWVAATAILLIRLFFAVRTLARVQHNAKPTLLDGQSVLVTESLGPAVIGLIRPRVAVPSWFMQLDAPLRALVLRHETEHCRSRDPQLVWFAAIAVAAMPWNVGLWWLSRRLRLALEIDCDTRTLKRESSHEQYGKLLLLIAQRQSGYPLATMLAESTSHLSRRITAMQMTPLRRPVARAIIFGTIAVGAVVAACSPRIATDLTGPKALVAASTSKSTSPGATYFADQVEKPAVGAIGTIAPKYPVELKNANIGGHVLAQFVVNTQGVVEMNTLKILNENQVEPAFATSVREALPKMQFQPAEIAGKKVKQLVQQPFEFSNVKTAGSLQTDAIGRPENRINMVPSKTMKGVAFADGEIVNGVVTRTAPNSAGTLTKTSPASENALQKVDQSSAQSMASNSTLNSAGFSKAPAAGQPYFEFQVDRAVIAAPGSKGPAYPEGLKAAKVEGVVLAQFVVDENGVADVRSFKVLKSDRDEFIEAIRDALPNMRFVPAQVNGLNVKQLVQQPFQFSLSK